MVTDPRMERYPESWTNIISSAGANNNSLCRLYRYLSHPSFLPPSSPANFQASEPNCTGSSVLIDYPGYSDLSAIGFEDKAYSFRCSDIHNTTARPRPAGLRCMYMTNEAGWAGEGLNLCTEPGQCAGELPDGLTKKVMSAGASEDSRCYLYR